MARIILERYIVVPEGELEVVKSELENHTHLTRDEDGCLEFQVDQHGTDKCRFNVHEKFRGYEAFQYHQERAQSSYWGKITKNVERHYKIYEKS